MSGAILHILLWDLPYPAKGVGYVGGSLGSKVGRAEFCHTLYGRAKCHDSLHLKKKQQNVTFLFFFNKRRQFFSSYVFIIIAGFYTGFFYAFYHASAM